MRKSLFFAAALSLSLSVSAQSQFTEVFSLNAHKNEALTKKMVSQQLDAKRFSSEQMSEVFMKRAANPEAGSYMAHLESANFDDAVTAPTFTISGKNVTIDGLFPLNNVASLKGTFSNGVLTIPTTVLMKDGFGAGVDLAFGTINGSNAQPNESVSFVYDEQTGVFSYTDENNILMLYASENGSFAGYYMWINKLEITPMTALVPYFTTEDVWYTGVSSDMMALNMLVGGVPSAAQTVDYTSYVSMLKNYDYQLDWTYGNSSFTGDELKMSTSSPDLNFPSVIASYEGNEVSGFALTDQETRILVDGSAEIEGTDYGWTTYKTWAGLLLPTGLDGSYAYGSGKTRIEQEQTAFTDLILYYPNKNAEFSFSTIDMLGISCTLEGSLTVSVVKATMEKGFPRFDENSLIAQSRAVNVSDMSIVGEIDITSSKKASYGILSAGQFVSVDEDGFEVDLDKVTVNGSFAVIISGLKAADFGIFMDGVNDFSKMALNDTENVFLQTDNGYIIRKAFYRNGALFFRGAGWSGGSSISSVENAAEGIVAVANGASFELSYPEGVSSVQVVNVAGQTVAEYSLEGTSATVSVAGLTNGLYILKFNNGAAVKVLK